MRELAQTHPRSVQANRLLVPILVWVLRTLLTLNFCVLKERSQNATVEETHRFWGKFPKTTYVKLLMALLAAALGLGGNARQLRRSHLPKTQVAVPEVTWACRGEEAWVRFLDVSLERSGTLSQEFV